MLDDRELVKMFKAGSEAAARELFDRYCERLLKLAKRRIGQRMTSRVDPEDVIQSAFRTFFTRVRNDQFTFEGENDLFKLLIRLTVHKTLRQIAFHQAAKRDAAMESPHGSATQEQLLAVAGDEPSPEVVVTFMDLLETFLDKMPDQERRILELKLQGYSSEEIAQQMGLYDRKVRRVLERIRGIAAEEAALLGGDE